MPRSHPWPVRRTALSAVLALTLAAGARGQTATLLADVNPPAPGNPVGFGLSAEPEGLAALGNRLVFTATEESTGSELWATDGTAAGTSMLADVCPGSCSARFHPAARLGNVQLLWVTLLDNDPVSSLTVSLWRSDGTRQGTYRLGADLSIFPFNDPDTDVDLPGAAVLGNALYFEGCRNGACQIWKTDGTVAGTAATALGSWFAPPVVAAGRMLFFRFADSALALWKSDGTTAGTVLVKALGPASPRLLTAASGRVFFALSSTAAESGLWVSDGTTAGTRHVTSFGPAEWLKPVGDRVYFLANDVVHGEEIWVSDGTAAGTRRVTDFGFSQPFGDFTRRKVAEELAVVGERVVFRATDGLSPDAIWGSQGTPESTARLTDLCQLGCPFHSRLVAAGGRVFFERGSELWVSDGTGAGTRSLRRFSNASAPIVDLLEPAGNQIRFVAQDGIFGSEVWISDGTPAGTRPLTDLPGGVVATAPVVATGSRLYFQARDAQHGRELWVSDGPGTTRLVADIAQIPPGSQPQDLTAAGDRLFWTACRPGENLLLTSAGTPETTAVIPGVTGFCSTPVSAPSHLAAAGSKAFFLRVDEASRLQLWASDGTSATALTHLGAGSFLRTRLVSLAGKLLFVVQTGQRVALWESDGTPPGTVERFELPPGSAEYLTAVGAEIFFWSFDPANEGIYRSDGTAAGTRRLSSGLRAVEPPEVQRLGSAVFFNARDENGSIGLYRTDDTATGASLVRASSAVFHGPQKLTAFAGALYFFAPVDGRWQLWRSDGTPGGTAVLHPFALPEEPNEVPPFELVPFAGRLYFAADDGAHGLELWATDGTAAGTVLVRDLRPGSTAGGPAFFTVAGGRLYFAADDGVHGRELWQSDGTAAGSRLVQDLAPQGISSSPSDLAVAGNRLFFAADDHLSGREVWALPLGATGCQPSPHRLCLQGGRYQVEAAWRDFSGREGLGTAVPLSGDTGYFWFFAPENVEAAVKVLDGRGVNGHVWVFYGALSSVEYSLTVTDTETGLSRRYFNPSGQLASVGDTNGFGPQGASLADQGTAFVASPSPAVTPISRFDPAAKEACAPSATRLCLGGGRFAVDVAWKDFAGHTGTGKAVPLTADTGTFWFFDSANVELVLKVLDGRPVTGKYWVFYGALSSVEYSITVTDTATGQVKVYRNPSGRLASVADTGAF